MNNKQIEKLQQNADVLLYAALNPSAQYETLLAQTNSLWMKTIQIIRTVVTLNDLTPTAADITTHYLEKYDVISNRVVRDTLLALAKTEVIKKDGHHYSVPSMGGNQDITDQP